MERPGSQIHPLRVAVIGAGPAGFYAADHLLQQADLAVQVDLFDRLPTPFGLVRGGVAPDHPKIKSVALAYERTAALPGFRFFGNVELSSVLKVADLEQLYHQVIYCTGAQTDRRLGIPGEDLEGSRTATEFVAWYNGHPDYRDQEFDLSVEDVVVVGVGNVAVDVCRILCRTPEELARTDIADHALEALSRSRVRRVTMLGRRGPAQAAFTNPEIRELGTLAGAEVVVPPEEAELDPLTREFLDKHPDRSTAKKVEILAGYARNGPVTGRPRCLTLRFLVSPVEILGDERGRVKAVKVVRNDLYLAEDGHLRPRPTGRSEVLPAGLVLRSVGYRGVPLPGLPFDERRGVIPNREGRVVDPHSGEPLIGHYVAGWIKRGATGVIGTNKPDAVETVTAMLEDLEAGRVLQPPHPEPTAVERLLRQRDVRYVTYEDWKRIDAEEVARGRAQGRPRVKFPTVEEMLRVLEGKQELDPAGAKRFSRAGQGSRSSTG